MFLGVTPSDSFFLADSPHFQAPQESALNRSELSCLPETRSPEKEAKPVRRFQPLPIESRLIQRSQASKRKLEELRQRKEISDAADVRDRPLISQKSKDLAANAEQRFWNQHSGKTVRRHRDNLVTLKERIQFVLGTAAGSPGKQAGRVYPATSANTRRSPPSDTRRPPLSMKQLHDHRQCKKTHSRKSSGCDTSVVHNYRSITPVPLRIAFDAGCDLSRFQRVPDIHC